MNSAVVFLALAALVGAQEIHFAKPHYHTVVAEESGRAVPVAYRMHNVDSAPATWAKLWTPAHGAAFAPVAGKSAILSRSAFAPETAYLTESAFAPKSAILAESAFAPKSGILAGSAFAPKSAILAEALPAGRWATVMENTPESDMAFQGLRRFAPESNILVGSAFSPETAYLTSSIVPKSAILAGSAFSPKSAILAGSAFSPKSAILAGSAFAPKSAILDGSAFAPKSAILAESVPASAGRWASIMENAPESAIFAEPAAMALSGARYMADDSDAILKVVPAGRWAAPKSAILADLEDAAESGIIRKVVSFAPKQAAIEVASPYTPVSAGRWAVAPAFPSTYASRMAPKSWTVSA